MASPQTHDGYTAIAHELMDAILGAGFNKREMAVVFGVLRKTYGYKKKIDHISNGQLSKITKISAPNVSRVVVELIEKQVLTEEEGEVFSHGQRIRKLGVNKNYEQWKTHAKTARVNQDDPCQNDTSAKTAPVPKRHLDPCQNDTQTHAKTTHTKENTKLNTKHTGVTPGLSGKASAYTQDFEEAWKAYPKRHRQDNKKAAFKAWKARIQQKESPQEMINGVKAYAEAMREDGKIGTQFVMQAATFFGPDEHYSQQWETKNNDELDLAI